MMPMKKITLISLLLLLCLSLSGCMLMDAMVLGGGNDSASKEKVFEYVKENTEALSSFPYDAYRKLTNDEAKISFIQDTLGADTIVKDVYRYSPSVLQFYCGGSGIVTSSDYSGFYYSKGDEPYAFEFESEAQFTQISENAYEWQSEDQQRAVYTERIQTNWFWYRQVWD